MANCTHCNTEYETTHKCGATIFRRDGETFLVGHYGSTIIDGDLFKVLTDDYKNGIICDSCIEDGLDKKHFTLILALIYKRKI